MAGPEPGQDARRRLDASRRSSLRARPPPARASRRGPRPPPHHRRWRTAPAGSRPPGSRARARRARSRHPPRPASLPASASATRVPCTCASHSGSRGRDSAARNAPAIFRHRGRLIAHVSAEVEARRRAPRSRPRCAACRPRAPCPARPTAAVSSPTLTAARRSASARSAHQQRLEIRRERRFEGVLPAGHRMVEGQALRVQRLAPKVLQRRAQLFAGARHLPAPAAIHADRPRSGSRCAPGARGSGGCVRSRAARAAACGRGNAPRCDSA